ncbi:MAG: hypothetical protein U0610_12385 [bacterium]
MSPADLPRLLARHLAGEIERVLRDTKDVGDQLALATTIVDSLARAAPSLDVTKANVDPPPRTLLSVHRTAALPSAGLTAVLDDVLLYTCPHRTGTRR